MYLIASHVNCELWTSFIFKTMLAIETQQANICSMYHFFFLFLIARVIFGGCNDCNVPFRNFFSYILELGTHSKCYFFVTPWVYKNRTIDPCSIGLQIISPPGQLPPGYLPPGWFPPKKLEPKLLPHKIIDHW